MASVHEIISFYKACFEEENKGGGIANFLKAKVEHHTLIKGKEEHLSGFLPYTPIDEKVAKKLQAQVALYQKEKELIYGSHFLLGEYIGFQGKTTRLIAPLLIYSAEVIAENELYFIRADRSNPTINPVVIDLLKSNNPNFDETAFYKQIPQDAISVSESGKLARLLDKILPDIDTTLMVDYPNNLSTYKINKLFKNNSFKNNYQLVPCSGFGLVKKSTKTRSTTAELDSISKNGTPLSGAIQTLFNSQFDQKHYSENGVINPVSMLSLAQENVLETADNYKLSMVVGPPGTGKSFTIANLALNISSQGDSVLVCSRNDGAVNVIEEKIKALLGNSNMCVRGGKPKEIKVLKNRLRFLLSRGYKTKSKNARLSNEWLYRDNYKRKIIRNLEKELLDYERKFSHFDSKELSLGKSVVEYDSNNGLWNRIFRFYLSKRIQHSEDSYLWDITTLYLELTEKFIDTKKDYINSSFENNLIDTVVKSRDLLKNYLQSLRATNTSRQKQFLESIDLKELFNVFPIWLTNTKDVGEILPLEKELFDVVIIDEASQCDIATCLPLLQRAKKAVIVGDPKQLNHISFLSKTKQHFLQEKNHFTTKQMEAFTHRNKSILDLTEESIQDQQQSNFLDEHFRSKPELIRFSNKEFYFDSLNIMTNHLKDKTNSLFHFNISGVRDNNGINQKEIDFILHRIKGIIETDRNTITNQKQSIGILSPFRNQTDQIIASIQQQFTISEIENHKLLVGTAHSFQGEERDVMLLSFALDNNSHASAFRFLNQDDVFNVSITRAKSQQYIVTSFDRNNIPSSNLIRKYLDSFEAEQVYDFQKDGLKDQFVREIYGLITDFNYITRVDFSIAGVSIDIVVEKEGKLYGIDLVGFPGQYEKTIELYNYKALLRAGIKMIPIPYSLWRFKREVCETKIREFLGVKKVFEISK